MRNIGFQNIELTQKLFGYHNTHLEKMSAAFNLTINSRGNAISLSGNDKDMDVAEKLIRQLYDLLQEKFILTPPDLDAAINTIRQNNKASLKKIFLNTIFVTAKNRAISPRNQAQNTYANAIKENDILFSIGPAGTGKKCGLIEAKKILTRIKGIDFITFTKEDVVRHPLVSNIIDAYEKNKT